MLRARTIFLRRLLHESVRRPQSTASEVSTEPRGQNEEVTVEPPQTKLRARAPLVKNFFVGVVDKELLDFPEVIPRDDMTQLQQNLVPLQQYFENLAVAQAITPEVLENLQQLNIYAGNVPTDYNGKGWGFSQSLMAAEPESKCTSLALSLLPQRIVVDVLKELGSLQQQQRYLPQLASGALVASDAMVEYQLSEDDFFSTSADYQPESQSWALNGEKAFVVSGPLRTGAKQLFLVLAQSNRLAVQGNAGQDTTAFLVDGDTPGVTIGEPHKTLGLNGVELRRIKFDGVCLPAENVVGEPHDGELVAEALLRSSRLRTSLVALGAAKAAVRDFTQNCINTRQGGVQLA